MDMKINHMKVTILESIILELKHYYYPELSRNEGKDKDIRVILTKTHDEAKEVQLQFKYLFAISKNDAKHEILLNLYMKAYEYISMHFGEFINSELIQFNDERLLIYIDECLIKDSNIPIPYFGLLHEFDLIKLNIDKLEKDNELIKTEWSSDATLIPFEFDIDKKTAETISNSELINVFDLYDGKTRHRQMTKEEIDFYEYENPFDFPYSQDTLKKYQALSPEIKLEILTNYLETKNSNTAYHSISTKYNLLIAQCNFKSKNNEFVDEFNSRLLSTDNTEEILDKVQKSYDDSTKMRKQTQDDEKSLEVKYEDLVESALEAKYEMYNEFNTKNVNSGIVSDEIIHDISNIDKCIYIDLKDFTQLQKFVNVSNININSLLKNNVNAIIYDIKEDKIF